MNAASSPPQVEERAKWDGDVNNAFVVHPDLNFDNCYDVLTAKLEQAIGMANEAQFHAAEDKARGAEAGNLWALESILIQARAALHAMVDRQTVAAAKVDA